jgi:prepilin-type N-terminal cleavage/methylation domain-containing protein
MIRIRQTGSWSPAPAAGPAPRAFGGGFTLIELLVVVAILSLLVALLVPALGRAKAVAREAVCRSNIRQLHLANANYAAEHDGYYVPAAPDIFEGFGGRRRWHGVRESDGVSPDPAENIFDPMESPLRPSLGDGEVRRCPETVDFVRDGAANAFEAACGGYGYNAVGVGSRSYELGYCAEAVRVGMKAEEIARPDATVMFADTALLQGYRDMYLIEYSFAEPPFTVERSDGEVVEGYATSPSIHFRHLERASVVWCDGRATGEPLSFSPLDERLLSRFRIGWFGPEDNSRFDPF